MFSYSIYFCLHSHFLHNYRKSHTTNRILSDAMNKRELIFIYYQRILKQNSASLSFNSISDKNKIRMIFKNEKIFVPLECSRSLWPIFRFFPTNCYYYYMIILLLNFKTNYKKLLKLISYHFGIKSTLSPYKGFL